MIVEGNNHCRPGQAPSPERSEMMKITGTVKKERCELRLILAIKLLDQTRRRGEAKLRSPVTRVEHGQVEDAFSPRLIQIEMKSAAQINYRGERD